jgi:hypothetical protein
MIAQYLASTADLSLWGSKLGFLAAGVTDAQVLRPTIRGRGGGLGWFLFRAAGDDLAHAIVT